MSIPYVEHLGMFDESWCNTEICQLFWNHQVVTTWHSVVTRRKHQDAWRTKEEHPEKTSNSHCENMTTIWGCNRTYSLGALGILQSKMELFRLGHLEWRWWFHRKFGWSPCHQHDCDCKILNLHFPLAPYIKFCNDQFRMEELNMFPYMHGTRPLQEHTNNFQVHHILDEAQVIAKIRSPWKTRPKISQWFLMWHALRFGARNVTTCLRW